MKTKDADKMANRISLLANSSCRVTVIYKKKIENLLSSVENLLFPTYTEIHVKWKCILSIYMQSPAKDSFIDLKLIFLHN